MFHNLLRNDNILSFSASLHDIKTYFFKNFLPLISPPCKRYAICYKIRKDEDFSRKITGLYFQKLMNLWIIVLLMKSPPFLTFIHLDYFTAVIFSWALQCSGIIDQQCTRHFECQTWDPPPISELNDMRKYMCEFCGIQCFSNLTCWLFIFNIFKKIKHRWTLLKIILKTSKRLTSNR